MARFIQKVLLLCVAGSLLASCASTTPALQATATRGVSATEMASATPAVILTATFPAVTPTATAVPLPSGREVIVNDSGSTPLRTTLYGEGELAVLMANMSYGGAAQWTPLVARLDPHTFTAVTFEYRSNNGAEEDARLVSEYLRAEGFTRIACVGASLGVTACSRLAAEPEMAGMVLMAGRLIRNSLSEASYPKLFVSGALDPIVPNLQAGYEQSAEPRELMLLENNLAHGTDLFTSDDGEQVLTRLMEFLKSLTLS